jgi:hypothetical protein
MRTFIATVVGITALFVSADAQPRRVGPFTAVEAGGKFRVEVTVGQSQSVEVTGADADQIATTIRGDELLLTPAQRTWFGPEPDFDAVVHITMPRVNRLQAMRGADMRATDLRVGALSLDAAMGGQLKVSGVCTRLDASASMGGMIDARDLDCASANASASMGGSVDVRAHDAGEASASMGGSVDVRGEPARRSSSATMGGDVSIN